MQNKKQLIICSADLAKYDFYTNQERQKAMFYRLNEIGAIVNGCRGVYKGKSEPSFLVEPKNNEQFEEIKTLVLDLFEQESLLYQETSGLCSLIFANGNVKKLGELKQVKSETAKNLDSYTIFNGKYYAAN